MKENEILQHLNALKLNKNIVIFAKIIAECNIKVLLMVQLKNKIKMYSICDDFLSKVVLIQIQDLIS